MPDSFLFWTPFPKQKLVIYSAAYRKPCGTAPRTSTLAISEQCCQVQNTKIQGHRLHGSRTLVEFETIEKTRK